MYKRFSNKLQKKSDKLSKIDYWKKFELFDLFDYLNKAEKLLIEMTNDNNKSQLLKFKEDYIEELYEINGSNVADFTKIWEWFGPTKEWDTLLGEEGKEIGSNVFRITNEWKKYHEFD